MAEPFPRAAVNPSASPWAREVEKRIQGVEKQNADLSQRLDQANRIIAAIKGRDTQDALNYRGDFDGSTSDDVKVTYGGKWRWDFNDFTFPKGWRRSSPSNVFFGPSEWPPGFVYGYQHPLDGQGLVLKATPTEPAWVEFDLPADRDGAVRWWYAYDQAGTGEVLPDENGLIEYDSQNGLVKGTVVGPIQILTTAFNTQGADGDSMTSWGNGYGTFNVVDYGNTGTAPDRVFNAKHKYRIEVRAAGPGPRYLVIDALVLATAAKNANLNPDNAWFQAELLRDSGGGLSGFAPVSTVVVPGTRTGGIYHAGDTVSFQGKLWTALTDTDGSDPVEGDQWTSLSGGASDYVYAGEWSP